MYKKDLFRKNISIFKKMKRKMVMNYKNNDLFFLFLLINI
ncbi:hypothetical protein PFMALIP_04957 [Plasmodium falciparum MaliPS096_E11]|uniref:Uncharacterized protein n=1 Tax=Plasmodium falciparum MaliPS096_E11 TaxID=1036727 RepID=A0A024WII3_PLAFA|nr:hypothetical protein PFMALIP_04957 [Plasmodium falciparum MaliPS096_E11]